VNNRWEQDAVEGATLVPLDNYALLDISANYIVADGWELFGRVENALDENYRELPGYNTAGRAAYLGTRFSF
jgi:vitamin B12 transporter